MIMPFMLETIWTTYIHTPHTNQIHAPITLRMAAIYFLSPFSRTIPIYNDTGERQRQPEQRKNSSQFIYHVKHETSVNSNHRIPVSGSNGVQLAKVMKFPVARAPNIQKRKNQMKQITKKQSRTMFMSGRYQVGFWLDARTTPNQREYDTIHITQYKG